MLTRRFRLTTVRPSAIRPSVIRPSRIGILAFVAFFLMISAWAFAVPYDGTPDEHDHVYRAFGVWSGEVTPKPEAAVRGSGAFQTVPRGLTATLCWQNVPTMTPADCAGEPTADRTPVRLASGAGRYQPVYYAIVGLPLKLWPGWAGLVLARLIGGAVAAALLAGAVVSVMRYSMHRLMMGGLVLAVTPMVMYFCGSVNPNGVEIAAGVAFFAALIPLCTAKTPRVDPALLTLAGVSALLLATLRTTGPLYLGVAVASFVLPLRAGNGRQLWRTPAVKRWVAAVAVAIAASGVWIVAMKASDLGDFRTGHYSSSQAVYAVLENWPILFQQMVGVTSWLFQVGMTPPANMAWLYSAGGVVLFAFVFGRWVDRWRLFGLVFGGLVLPMAAQVYYLNTTGFIMQGRYLLPMLVGVLLLSANVLEERGLDERRSATLTRVLVVLLLPIHLLCLVTGMARWQQGRPVRNTIGLGTLNPFVGRWHPPLGSVVPLAIEVAGLVVFGVLAWTATRRTADAVGGAVAGTETVAVPNGRASREAAALPTAGDGGDARAPASTAPP